MSFDNDNASAAPLFIELRPGMRKALADAVDAFLNLLDQIDAVRTRRTGPKELATTARTKASCLSRPAMRSQRSARRPPSISNMLGPRLAWPMRSTKPSRRSAGRAMGAAIPRWRCAAMTTIGRGLQGRATKKRTTATKESWTATIWTLGSIRRTCQAAMARCGDHADD
ncbi:hypothetical protein C5688_16760 [Methylocystis sp. MitZ-2018]|jgi:hypothetical protein|nr:hypothetical protein C5688_16760 [Methylocystis sp. MitZ-2018]